MSDSEEQDSGEQTQSEDSEGRSSSNDSEEVETSQGDDRRSSEEGEEEEEEEEEEDEEEEKEAVADEDSDQGKQSPVYSAARDTLFLKNTKPNLTDALTLDWLFGMNPALPVFTLQDDDRLVVFYAGAHVAIIYNHTLNCQYKLEGLYSSISCMCVSEDRRWLGLADLVPKSTVMIWDSYSGIAVQTLFDCHPGGGVAAMSFSGDAKYLVTLGREEVQCVCIWDWTNETEQLLYMTEILPKYGFQVNIKFNLNNNAEILSNSETEVIFYSTSQGSLKYITLEMNEFFNASPVGFDTYPPPHRESRRVIKMKNKVTLSQSVFHWKGDSILSGTAEGSIVVWDLIKKFELNHEVTRDKLHLISLQKYPITMLTVMDRCIVTGDTQGHVNFYDETFLPVMQYNKLNLDEIVSISFSKEYVEGFLEDCTLEVKPTIIRNFVVSTVSAMVVQVNAAKGVPQILLRENCEPLHAVACHPNKPIVVMGNVRGIIRVWDYHCKRTVSVNLIEAENPIQCMTFDPQGLYLAVGFGNGAVHILDPETLQSDPQECFQCTEERITQISFSADSKYFATVDTGKVVSVFRWELEEDFSHRWKFVGKHKTHYKPIKDILFGVHPDTGKTRLLSLGLDRKLVEYDLANSNANKLLILKKDRIEQSALPMCMVWYPPITREDFLLTVSNQYKMKLLTSTAHMCRKTLLGPRCDTPIKRLSVLPLYQNRGPNSYYMTFITEDKVGIQILPIDGNPFKYNALICHPMGVSDFACSHEGRYVFTAGGPDCTVMSWKIRITTLEKIAASGGEDLDPFYTLLEGGRSGKFFREMEDFFYFCQIRHQGIGSMETRTVSTKIPLTQVPSIMRALAFFPTEREIEDMQNEVKFSKFAETGQFTTDIDLEELIKLYVNHRPAFGVSINEITEAFHVLGSYDSTGQLVLERHKLLELLQVQGEPLTEEEVAHCLTRLLGLSGEKDKGEFDFDICDDGDVRYALEHVIPEEITMEIFTNQILGFPAAASRSGRSSSTD